MDSRIKRVIAAFAALAVASSAFAQSAPVVLKLWPDGAPDDNGLTGPEKVMEGGRIGNISDPELLVFPAENPNGQAVIMCPGGGYNYVAAGHEGTDFAPWFNSMGITYAVLKYRMPNGHCEIPLEDAHRAITVMRNHAGEYGFTKLGIMGGSAGGNVASNAAVHYTKNTRPDFQILLYPLITFEGRVTPGGKNMLFDMYPSEEDVDYYSSEKNVASGNPPAFIAHSQDDPTVPLSDSHSYHDALKEAGVPVEMHIYPEGGHGWGFKDDFKFKEQFKQDLAKWLGTL